MQGLQSNIQHFTCYREFLVDRYEQLKRVDNFSFRQFSKEAGFGSPNYLLLVIKGERNLTPDSVLKFCKGLRLNHEDSKRFVQLVKNETFVPVAKSWERLEEQLSA